MLIESCRQSPFPEDADGCLFPHLEHFHGQLCVIGVGVSRAPEKGRRKPSLHTPQGPCGRSHVSGRFAAFGDGGHLLVHRKYDRVRRSISSRHIRKPLHVTAQPFVIILHDQEIDLLCLHPFPDFFPPPLQLSIGYGHGHDFSFICPSDSPSNHPYSLDSSVSFSCYGREKFEKGKVGSAMIGDRGIDSWAGI